MENKIVKVYVLKGLNGISLVIENYRVSDEKIYGMLTPIYTFEVATDDILQAIGIPTADVVERSEYDKLLEENKQLKRIISDKVNEDLKCAFEVKELHSKIDNALADMQSMLDQEVLNDNVISDVGQGIEIAMELLKENIGE